MKIFGLTTLSILSLIFAMNWISDPSHLRVMLEPTLTETFFTKNPERCAIDSSLVSKDPSLKIKLLELNQSETIAVGTSRVLAIQRKNFPGKSFTNFGIIGLNPEDYVDLVELLRTHPTVKTVLVDSEIWEYIKHGDNRFWDFITDFKNPSLRSWATRLVMRYRSLGRASMGFPGPAFRLWNALKESLSYESTRKSIERLLNEGRLKQAYYKIPLPERSKSEAKCLISATPTLSRTGAVSAYDMSQYTPEDLLGEPLKSDLAEFDDQLLDQPGSHWRLYDPLKYSRDFSSFKLAYMEYLLSEAKKLGVRVIGFTSPYPSGTWQVFRKIGIASAWQDFETRMEAVFKAHGHRFIRMPPADAIGCQEPQDFTDAWHAWYPCMEKTLRFIYTR